jgi:hypothetical protein
LTAGTAKTGVVTGALITGTSEGGLDSVALMVAVFGASTVFIGTIRTGLSTASLCLTGTGADHPGVLMSTVAPMNPAPTVSGGKLLQEHKNKKMRQRIRISSWLLVEEQQEYQETEEPQQ